MHVVTRRAGEIPFTHRHVIEPVLLVDHVAVARRTQLHLVLGFDLMLPFRRVDAVARGTGQVPLIVLAAFPQCMRRAVMAGRARRAHIRWPRRLVERPDEGFVAALGVCFARPMTALAAMRRGRRSRVRGDGMRRALVGPRVVTREAGVLADIFASWGLRRRGRGLWRLFRRSCGRGRRGRLGLWRRWRRLHTRRRDRKRERKRQPARQQEESTTESHGTARSPA
jgi:hypothetical protein